MNTPPSLTPTANPLQFRSTKASITINNTVITSNLQQWIRNNCLCSDISRYIQRKTGLTNAQMEEIEWDRLGNALERQKLHTQIQLIKFMHNWLNTGMQKQKFYKDAVAGCPICCAENETWTHMFQCPHDNALSLRSLALTKFKSSLIKMSTAPIIWQVLYYKVAQWCRLPTITPLRILSDSTGNILRDAVDTQHDLGWQNFMKGRVAKQWSQAQAEYCRSLPRLKNLIPTGGPPPL
eukprot:2072258-Ditylum_brightwellii.AAC.1